MTSASLFRKLQDIELELGRLEKHESQEKKSKGISLKVDSKEDKDDGAPEEDENFMLLVKKAWKREASTSMQDVTCYECGKQQGHIKSDCPKLSKKGGFKGKKEFKNTKAYVAWEDNEISSSSGSESDDYANLALMASHYFDDEEYKVSSNISIYDSDAQGAINKLLKECKILYKTISSQKKIISSLEEKVVTSEKDVCLKTTSNLWYLGSGCSKHMTGDINKFSNLALKVKGYVTYGDNNKGRILVKCLVVNNNKSWLWHKRFAHIHMERLNKLIKHDLVIGLPKIKYTWTFFLVKKSDAFKVFNKYAKQIQNEKSLTISSIRSDHGGEFQNASFEEFCEEHGIFHNFSAPRTPQQNGVVERKNMSFVEFSRTMLSDSNLPKPILKKTPYELFKGRKPNVSHFHIFGCKCFTLNNDKDNLGKFDEKSDEDVPQEDSFKGINDNQMEHHEEPIKQQSNANDLPKEWRTHRDHPIDKVIGDISQGVATRLNLKDACLNIAFVSQIEPSKVDEALGYDQWIVVI
ncbi:uncharacterized protein LOC127122675 [Lathyrus oleraceus]|uniref:uncharacterized protein LOC127122675 n=1 Tax=Pisum sativum TaxID=3888 RepID=UPI0021CE94E9|nr:uncharacterized protein LOC127122675 [Pisum sativum]